MTPRQIELVQSSWLKVTPNSDHLAELFYGRLFQFNPSLRPLFDVDLKNQGKRLMVTLNLAVISLTNLRTMMPAVQHLGRRHAKYQVSEGSYAAVGQALFWTLEKCLGDDFTDDVEEAWKIAYATISRAMVDACRESESAKQCA